MTRIHFLASLSGLVFGLISVAPAHADDSGLYGDAIPSDAAFVRWLDHNDPIDRTAFEHDFSEAVVPANTYVAVSASLLEGAEAGTYYSVVRAADGTVHEVREPARDDASKVHLFLLNTGATPISLQLPDAGAEVIGATASLEAKARAVNPVTVYLAVHNEGSGELLDHFDVALRRGQNLTFAFLNGEVIAIPSAFGPVVSAE